MRLIGLLGGMSWESSAEYYRLINQDVHSRLGGHHSAPCLLYSVDFAAVEEMQRAGDWDAAGKLLAEAARGLERGGADLLVLCTNTMHRLAGMITQAVGIPLLHIADATATTIDATLPSAGARPTVGLLATRYTMEQEFYRGRLAEHGIDVLVPEEPDRTAVHDIIYDELVHGVVRPGSRERYREVMANLVERGAAGIIYGCTEITLLVGAEDTTVPVFDTTRLHALAAVDYALAD